MGLLPRAYYDVRKFLKHRQGSNALFQKQAALNAGRQVQRWNWWREDAHSRWFDDFIIKRGLLEGSGKTVALCSVFGEREVLDKVDADVRIFRGELAPPPSRTVCGLYAFREASL